MVRLVGVEIPDERRVDFGLTRIYGVGWERAGEVLEKAKIKAEKRVGKLSRDELSRLAKVLETYVIEGDLRRQVAANISRLEEIGSFRGRRHAARLPVRGQRTRSNARTVRGRRRQTVGAMKKEELAKLEQQAKQKKVGGK